MTVATELATREPGALATRYELEVDDLLAQVSKIQTLMQKVMHDGEHYGVIPGTGGRRDANGHELPPKPTLLKPGAEKLCLLFRLDPQYHSGETVEGKHLTVKTTCTLWHIPTGQRWGSGEGSCSTKESKYAYRQASRVCPDCGKDAIIKGKEQYGGGWLCFGKKGGCGAKFKDGAAVIETQPVGRVLNEDLADQYNTVLKMSNKRALVAAVLNVTAASDIFTQDLEEMERPEPARGQVIDAEAIPVDQNATDRRKILDDISQWSRDLGLTKGDYKANWTNYVGKDVPEDRADLGRLLSLATYLDDQVRERAKSAAGQQETVPF
jgi:hypothetical protein